MHAHGAAPSPEMLTRTCTGCLTEKTADNFYKNKAKKFGIEERCIPCWKQRATASYRLNPEPAKARARTRRTEMPGAIKAGWKKWYAEHAEEAKAYQVRYRRTHPDKVRSRNASYYQANRENCVAARRAYYRLNKEVFLEAGRRYRGRYPEAHRETESRRRAAKRRAAIEKFGRIRFMLRMEACGFRCAYCGGKWEHADHVKPLARGGPHILANLRPACASCNLRKGDMRASEWLRRFASPVVPMPIPG